MTTLKSFRELITPQRLRVRYQDWHQRSITRTRQDLLLITRMWHSGHTASKVIALQMGLHRTDISAHVPQTRNCLHRSLGHVIGPSDPLLARASRLAANRDRA